MTKILSAFIVHSMRATYGAWLIFGEYLGGGGSVSRGRKYGISSGMDCNFQTVLSTALLLSESL
jgi:hypothetical protein